MSSLDKKRLLTRKELATELTDAGYPIKSSTLAVMACRGDGPPFRKWGRIPVHEFEECLEWARNRASKKVRSTAELSTFSMNDTSTHAGDVA